MKVSLWGGGQTTKNFKDLTCVPRRDDRFSLQISMCRYIYIFTYIYIYVLDQDVHICICRICF